MSLTTRRRVKDLFFHSKRMRSACLPDVIIVNDWSSSHDAASSWFRKDFNLKFCIPIHSPLTHSRSSSSSHIPYNSFCFLSHDLGRYISEFTETAGRPEFVEADIPDQEVVGHPVQAFQLIKRLTIEWRDVKKIMGQASSSWESK